MRKYLLFILLLALQIIARGQTTAILDDLGLPHPTAAKSVRYWFDDDAGSMTTIVEMNGSHSVDVSSLIEGLHTVHYQIIDSEGHVSVPYSRVFLKVSDKVSAEAHFIRYWFDDDTNVMTCSVNQGNQTLDISSLIAGLHTLHYQVVDSNNEVSYIASRVFLKIGSKLSQDATASQLVYWFDDAENKTAVSLNSGIQMLDASSLLDGLHTLHYMVVCSDGSRTSAYSSIFLRMNIDIEKTDAHKLRYWFDEETALTEIELVAGVQTLDTSHLLGGLHTVHYQLIDERETSAIPVSGIFLKTAEGAGSVAQKLRYWFDDNTEVKTVDVMGGNYMLDVSTLLTGLHTLHYQIIDDKGNVGGAVSGLFMKQYDKVVDGSENVITHYTYWMNDNSADNKRVKIENPSSPYQLITLLPMIKAPIRSYSFHFEVKDEMPTVYAKNDLHIRFEDATGYWVDAAHSFVDYSVSKTIKDFSELKTSQTFARPEENDIKWFKFEAASGDTIAFRASQATSLQVFAPSGKEILTTMGDKSVQYSGAHTWEDGTYYVAVHDVTGSKPNVTLDYMHMDKYDVVSQDVRVVGNGGCSTITFQGNGFKDLYAVDLKDSKGNIIESIDVGHESDASTTVTFDFTDAKLGKYNAVFHFTEEDKTFANNITVEEAKDIELETKVSYPSTFLRGTSVTYTVEITNKGNMTAYKIPIRAYIGYNTINAIKNIGISGADLVNLSESVDFETFTEDEVSDIKNSIEQLGEKYLFNTVRALSQSITDSIYVKNGYIFVSLPPYSTKTLSITILSDETVDVWFTLPTEWFPLNGNVSKLSPYRAKTISRSSARDSYCCITESIECGISLAVSVADAVSMGFAFAAIAGPEEWPAAAAAAAADCIAGAVANMYHNINYTICKGSPVDDLKNNFESQVSLLNVVLSCVGTLKASYKIVKAILAGVSTDVVANDVVLDANCLSTATKQKPNCPPNPGGGGGSSTPVNSYDPNDIYGYIAPSGSMYVGDDVLNMPYRIEFENDTTFATSAAHTVVVKDTLDAKIFDLSSYQPNSIKIGDKSVQLKGDKTFVTTFDMRPEINAIAQVEGLYDEKKGIATWQFTSLDPMTMEPTNDIMQGFLPVNYDGSGIGEVAYNINRKTGLSDGTAISNKASIVFDNNDAIETPVWTNIIDAIPPVTHISDVEQVNDTIVRVHFDGEDNSSGIWKYALYVQYGENTSWNQVAENDTICFDFRFYKDINYGFCVVATDYAGNVEKKIIQREYKFLNGEGEKVDGISSPYENQVATNKAYDLNGRLIQEEGYSGIIIKNRKKLFKR